MLIHFSKKIQYFIIYLYLYSRSLNTRITLHTHINPIRVVNRTQIIMYIHNSMKNLSTRFVSFTRYRNECLHLDVSYIFMNVTISSEYVSSQRVLVIIFSRRHQSLFKSHLFIYPFKSMDLHKYL